MTNSVSTLLIVDDAPLILSLMESLFEDEGYRLIFAETGTQALAMAAEHLPDIILLDLMLPDISGIEVCQRLRADPKLAEVPIIMVTALTERHMRLQAIEAGVDEFITKPFDNLELLARVRTVARLNRYRRLTSERSRFQRLVELSPDGLIILDEEERVLFANATLRALLGLPADMDLSQFTLISFVSKEAQLKCQVYLRQISAGLLPTSRLETTFTRSNGYLMAVELSAARVQWGDRTAVQVIARDISARKRIEAQIQQANQELVQAYDATLEGWVHALDLRDHDNRGHTNRVIELSIKLARIMGVSDDDLDHIRRGALLHDIGKIGVPDSILLKQGPLTPEEQAIMHQHPAYSRMLLNPIEYLQPAIDIPYCHHERWDGTGYPQGLKGEEIPIAARIFAIVDTWDSATSVRPHRPESRSTTEIYAEIEAELGKAYDPRIGRLFLQHIEQWLKDLDDSKAA